VHPEAMRRNLDLTNGAVVSEAVMIGLGKKIGRQYAHDLVYDICICLWRVWEARS
jgi:3-carboxy-cis,cis-muconate cycloisomerase